MLVFVYDAGRIVSTKQGNHTFSVFSGFFVVVVVEGTTGLAV